MTYLLVPCVKPAVGKHLNKCALPASGAGCGGHVCNSQRHDTRMANDITQKHKWLQKQVAQEAARTPELFLSISERTSLPKKLQEWPGCSPSPSTDH